MRRSCLLIALCIGMSCARAEPVADPVQAVLQRITSGEIVFTGSDREILHRVLQSLRVPVESQIAVFSKTSMQAGLISPATPRVIYFSDSVYVGWVPNGLIEVITFTPAGKLAYYAMDPQDARRNRRTFVRENSCLRCHGTGTDAAKPALLMQSVPTANTGERLAIPHLVGSRTSFDQRWGGWYVTGYLGRTDHQGNAFAQLSEAGPVSQPSAARPMDLSTFFDVSRYLTATSDIAALLTFEHQASVQNTLIRAATLNASDPRESSLAIEDIVAELLFQNAPRLPDGISRNEAFLATYGTTIPSTPDGRRLGRWRLGDRLFELRCSPLVYSPAFMGLVEPIRQQVFLRLKAILSSTDSVGGYEYLGAEEKRSIYAILKETHPDAREF